MVKERYENLDGMRVYACIGIVLMHVLANGNFSLSGFLFESFIPSLTNMVFLFMLLSAFSMCCGYYERFKNGTVSLEQFYGRRYQRILPFFAVLCTAELIMDHNLSSLYEWFADLTLSFGLLPNANISVVGVGWFIGVVFLFYMLFPFFTVAIANKPRAWAAFGTVLLLHILCRLYFFNYNHVAESFTARTNIIYCAIFFVAGGLIYLYRDQLKLLCGWPKWIIKVVTVAGSVLYYTVICDDLTLLALFSLFTILALCMRGGVQRVFQNKAVRFLTGLSMEIYLCHMFVYRVIEKMKLLHLTGNETLNYCCAALTTFIGAMVFAYVLKRAVDLSMDKIMRSKSRWLQKKN